MAHRLHQFANGAELAEALADAVAASLAAGISERGAASLAVSGGTTPKAFFRALSTRDIDWSKVIITLVDERFVPPENDRSNHGLVKEGLLQAKAAAAKFVPLYHAVAEAEDAAMVASDDVGRIPRPFDVVVLGMGGDGHTASFFPGGNNLEEALRPNGRRGVVAMRAAGAGEERLTLNFVALRDARLLVLHIEGEAKKTVLDTALKQDAAGPLPIARVIGNASSDTEIYWAP
jgi:6-phosphogluconolactonase